MDFYVALLCRLNKAEHKRWTDLLGWKILHAIFHGIRKFLPHTYSWSIEFFMEARNSFFGLGVYLLKSKFPIEDKLRFPWYYTTFSTHGQSLFFHWFLSNSCHHSNSNGQPVILNDVKYLKASQTLYDETWAIWTTQPTQLVCEIREKSVRGFSSKSWFIFTGWFWSFLQFSPVFQER